MRIINLKSVPLYVGILLKNLEWIGSRSVRVVLVVCDYFLIFYVVN